MKTRLYIILGIVITIIITTVIFSIITIDYVYGHTRNYEPIISVMCPIVPIPDDFEANQIFFAMYLTDTGKQLGMIWYDILNTCVTQSEKFQLQEILDYCNEGESGLDMNLIGLSYNNNTHYINNDTCQWQKITNYPNTDSNCIPGQHRWISGEEQTRNDTHIYNKYKCNWEEELSWGKEWKKVYPNTTPFGYHYRDTTGNYDHCFSYKTDPEYGVAVQNTTHTLNIENCKWELKNEN